VDFNVVMSNQRFLKIVCFRFPTNVPPKKLNIFVFETKFIIEPKRSLSDLNFFGLYSNVLLLLKKSWNTSKSFGFVQKFLEKLETFCFCKKDVGTHEKVLVLFQNFWNKQKRSTLGSGTHQNVLVSFRFLASISERLCFRFYQCPDPDLPSRIRIQILL
jgi:hypothetical protein